MADLDYVIQDNPPRVVITAHFDNVNVTAATFTRVQAGGLTTTLRSGASSQVVDGWAQIDDYEAPLDVAMFYDVVQKAPSTGSEAGRTETFTIPSNGVTWLSDPVVNTRVLRLDEAEAQHQQVRAARAGVFNIVDRPKPIVIAARRASFTGELTFHTATLGQRITLLDIISRGQIALLRTPGDSGIGNVYIHIGDVTEDRVTDVYADPTRHWTLPITEVDRPGGYATITAGMRWIDVYSRWPNWQALANTGMTWQQLLDLPPI